MIEFLPQILMVALSCHQVFRICKAYKLDVNNEKSFNSFLKYSNDSNDFNDFNDSNDDSDLNSDCNDDDDSDDDLQM